MEGLVDKINYKPSNLKVKMMNKLSITLNQGL